MIIEPDSSVEYRMFSTDSEIISILQGKLDYKNVVSRVFKEFLSKETVEIDEKGFHQLLELWIELHVFTDEYVMINYPIEIQQIEILLYDRHKPESN